MQFADCPSPSAMRVATSRAAHQILEDEQVFKDPFAVASLGSANAASLMRNPMVHNSVSSRSMRAGIVARSRFAEDHLLKAIANGTVQYGIVGAGLDTWALRSASTLPAITTFELDQPSMQEWKTRLYSDNGWAKPANLRYITTDLREITTVDGLLAGEADLAKPVSLSVLGVLVYLDNEVVEREIAALKQLAAGSTIALDYRLDEDQLHPLERVMMQFTANMMAAGGEPWQSSCTPERMRELLSYAGFEVEEDLGPAELNACYFAGRRDGLQIAGGGFRYLSAVKR
ncbi:class I SAM-dependent methyltransferase [Lampropedia aestuarii]|uniref:S-adenosyl-L-methionine-dependent methyltransferase n=2 Tax=Lampropedia aestuarii TaxID=2562762 RepID=A0A4V6S7A1_9BURK|nr:class I SAM-dependent methyltransferase [Lampropedia aestuarii]